jgi:hypothetical protein
VTAVTQSSPRPPLMFVTITQLENAICLLMFSANLLSASTRQVPFACSRQPVTCEPYRDSTTQHYPAAGWHDLLAQN